MNSKWIIIIFMVVTLISFNKINAAPTQCDVDVQVDSYLAWYAPWLYIEVCGGSGDDCLVIVVIVTSSTNITNYSNSFDMEIQLSSITQHNNVLFDSNLNGSCSRPIANFTFPANSKAVIMNSDDPQWNGVEWDISNTTTDASGKIYKTFSF